MTSPFSTTAENLEAVAIIPARGGSKGIPRKNLRRVAGKPLIAHTVEAAGRARSILRVVVSTDCEEIAAVAREHGAEVVLRPAGISGDSAPSETALLHVLESLDRTEGYRPDLVVFLQCTSPLTAPEDIDGTVAALVDQKADTALAVTPFHYFLWKNNGAGDAVGVNHDKGRRPMRQELPEQFLETGAVYVMRRQGLVQDRHRFFGKTAMYVMPPERCLEIDEPPDLRLAEAMMQEHSHRATGDRLPDPVAALVMDFDGVFTDNRVLVFEDGREAVRCNRGDGMGISNLKKAGLPMLVLSTEKNPVVAARCRKLDIPCVHGVEDKPTALQNWLGQRNIDIDRTVYLGNDINDLGCMAIVGCAVAVADAHPAVQRQADIVLESTGGAGAIRELCDRIERQGPTF